MTILKRVFVFILFAVCYIPPILYASASLMQKDERFVRAFERTTAKLLQVSSGKDFKLKAMNDSLEKTGKAAKSLLLQGADLEEAVQMAKEAQWDYSENSFAMLVEALALDQQGRPEAVQSFQDYLEQSEHHNRFETQFLNSVNFHEMRRGVMAYLESQGIHPMFSKKRFSLRHEVDQWMQNPIAKYSNLIVLTLLGGSLSLFLFGTFRKLWKRYRPLEKGFVRCKHCQTVVSKLMLECLNCRSKI
ncbi:MAG: hypothetical protein EXS63_07305 [Candidatus Omnitrophica bacterium]|nr:hypothetical protein [Candidatus Omnitrophota bacterium]